jgi:hypothetical protein
LGKGADTLRKVKTDLLKTKGLIADAKSDLDPSSIAAAEAASSNQKELADDSGIELEIKAPEWTLDTLRETFSEAALHERLERIIQNEAYSSHLEHETQEKLNHSEVQPAVVFNETDSAGLPTVEALLADLPADLELGTSPKERQLLLQYSLIKDALIPISELKKNPNFQISGKLEVDTAFYMLSILNFSFRFPSESTKESLDDVIQAAELRLQEISNEIDAEQIRVRADYLNERAKRHKAIQDVQTTLQQIEELNRDIEISKLDDPTFVTSIDPVAANLEMDVLKQELSRHLVEAGAAATQIRQFLTVAGKTEIDEALENHYVNTLKLLGAGADASQTPAINPPTKPPEPKAVPKTKRSLFKRILPAISLGFVLPLSAFSHTAVTAARQAVSASAQSIDLVQLVHIPFKQGGTVWQYAMDNGTTVDRLLSWNPWIKDVRAIPFGHDFIIPSVHSVPLPGLPDLPPLPNTLDGWGILNQVLHQAYILIHPILAYAEWAILLALAGVLAYWLVRWYRSRSTGPRTWATAPEAEIDGGQRGIGRRGVLKLFGGAAAVGAVTVAASAFQNAGTIPQAPAKNAAPPKTTSAAPKSEDQIESAKDNHAVGISPSRHQVALPQQYEPGEVVAVARLKADNADGLIKLPAGAVLIAAEPYVELEEDFRHLNDRWTALGREEPLVNPAWLRGTAPDYEKALIRIRLFKTPNTIDGKIQASLDDLSTLVNKYTYAYKQDESDRRHLKVDTTLTPEDLEDLRKINLLPMRLMRNEIAEKVAYLSSLFDERKENTVIRTGSRAVNIVNGTLIRATPGTTVQGGTELFEEENRTILNLGLSQEDALTLEAAPASHGLKFVDQSGHAFYLPLARIQQIAWGGSHHRDGETARSVESAKDQNPTFSSVGANPVQLVIEDLGFKTTSPLIYKGVYPNANSKKPFKAERRPKSIIGSVRLSSFPHANPLRHDIRAPLLRNRIAQLKQAEAANQNLLDDVTTAFGQHRPSEELRNLKETLEGKREELASARKGLEAELSLVTSQGEPLPEPKFPIARSRWIFPANLSDWNDAEALDRKFAGVPKGEELREWNVGDSVTLQISAYTTDKSVIEGGEYDVYLPGVEHPLKFLCIGTDNPDRKIHNTLLTLQGTFQLGSKDGISLAKFRELFRAPTESSITFGEIQFNQEVSSNLEQVVQKFKGLIPSWMKSFVKGAETKGQQVFDFTSHPGPWPLALLSAAAALIGALFIPAIRRRRVQVDGVSSAIDRVSRGEPRAVVPKPDLMSDYLKTLPADLEKQANKDLLVASFRQTKLGPVRKGVENIEKHAGRRFIQHIIGWGLAWYLIILPLWNNRELFLSVLHGFENITQLTPVLMENGLEWDVIKVAIAIVFAIFAAWLQRAGENVAVNPTALATVFLWILDWLVFIPFRAVGRWALRRRSTEREADTIDFKEGGVLATLSEVGRYFLRLAEERSAGNTLFAERVLKAFEDYNRQQPSRHRYGSGGPVEIISAEEARTRGHIGESLESIDQIRLRHTIDHLSEEFRGSLAIRAWLALVWSGVVIDLIPSRAPNTLRPTTMEGKYALSAVNTLVESKIYRQVSKGYHRAAKAREARLRQAEMARRAA